jgi:hypothetical protein
MQELFKHGLKLLTDVREVVTAQALDLFHEANNAGGGITANAQGGCNNGSYF